MTDVERVYNELRAVLSLLKERGEPSDIISFEQLAAKTLVLCAASYFERQICSMLLEVAGATGTTVVFRTFINKQALERRFHSMFNWNSANANAFFGLFGPDVKDWMADLIAADDALVRAVREFMFINSQRNRLVHENFAAMSIDVTLEEVWQKFNTASQFTAWLPERLAEASRAGGVPAA